MTRNEVSTSLQSFRYDRNLAEARLRGERS
jgi:hypothetical protein